MKTKSRTMLTVLVAVLALSALAAGAAQANEGPFYKVAGSRLAAGSSRELKVLGGGQIIAWAGIVVTCSKASAAAGAKILGTAPGTPEFSEQTITYSGCSISGNGTPCQVSNIKSTPLTATLVYSEKERKGHIDVLYKPVSGTSFATFTLTGIGCEWEGEQKLTGSVAAEALNGSEWIKVGSEPAATATQRALFPTETIRKVWKEATAVEGLGLKILGGIAVGIQGSSTLELASGELWGPFTA
jgi:hypothetical protein